MRVVCKCQNCETGPCYCEAMPPQRYKEQYDIRTIAVDIINGKTKSISFSMQEVG